jgi:hypothetical protein
LAGVIVGLAFDLTAPITYYGTMEVRPNMGSGRTLYKNIAYYNTLAKQNEDDKLAEFFKISLSEAGSISSFQIEPISNEELVITKFDNLFKSLDSLTALILDFDRFHEEFMPYEHSRHIIKVEGSNKNVFALLSNDIIKHVSENAFYKKQQTAEFDVLDQNVTFLKTSQKKVEELRKIYMEAIKMEAKKENAQGTSINMGTQTKGDTKELELFEKESTINSELNEITRSRVRNAEVVSVISEFEEDGTQVNDLSRKRSIKYGVVFFILACISAIGLSIYRRIMDKGL